MLNVKALTWAFGLTAAVVFCVCVAYGLMVPPVYHGVFGSWLVGFHGVTLGSFLIGLVEVVGGAVVAALLVGTLNNYFHRRWEMTTH
jgi:uncharacterized membrane protein YjjB (DUF3815 family)